ncbi:MAG: AMP-binding protein, partial [Cyanobacteria bacterium P01_C01_bin.72]
MTTSPIILSKPTDIGSTIIDILDYRATYSEKAIAYEFYVGENQPDDRLTYQELREKSQAIATELIARNLEGERVLLIYPAGLSFVTAFLGCLYAGAIAVPIYPPRRNQKLSRLETIVDDCTPKAVLTVKELEAKVTTYLSSSIEAENCLFTDKIESVESNNIDFQANNLGSKSIAFLQYTSGSTGNPKGVAITHQNIISNSNLIYQLFGHSAQSQGVSWLPFYHDMGLIGGV